MIPYAVIFRYDLFTEGSAAFDRETARELVRKLHRWVGSKIQERNTGWVMKRILASITILALLVLLVGCVALPDRRDAFEGLTVANPVYKDLTLGLVLSQNTKSAFQYAQQIDRTRSILNPGMGEGSAGQKVFEEIASLFRKNFKTFVKIEKVEDAQTINADLVAVLDVYAQLPNSNFEDAKIDVSVLLLTTDSKQIDMVRAEGIAAGVISPFSTPAITVEKASRDVAKKLELAINSSAKLVEFSKSKSGASIAIAAKPQTSSTVPDSDVDTPPARRAKAKENAYAIVIGIESYREKMPKADFADRDAKLIGEYLTRVMGYPEQNVVVRLNDKAAKGDLEKYFEAWLPNNVEPGSSVFIYYSGHGAPNPKTGDAYLVPYDGDPTFVDKTGYSLKRLYAALDKLPAKDITVVLDSCFSGAGGRSVLAQGAKPMVLSVENAMIAGGKTVVLAASSADQISSAYSDKGHGLLTYYFLKGLQGAADGNQDGAISLAELFQYVKPNVQRIARKQYNNEQTPQLLGNPELLTKGLRLVDKAAP